MSFDEINSLLKANNEKEKRQWERDRINWFYTLIAPGLSKKREPTDLVMFEWEKETKERIKKEPGKLTKEQIDKKTKEAEKWLNNR